LDKDYLFDFYILAKSGSRPFLSPFQARFYQWAQPVDEILHRAGQRDIDRCRENENMRCSELGIQEFHIILDAAFPGMLIPAIHVIADTGFDFKSAGVKQLYIRPSLFQSLQEWLHNHGSIAFCLPRAAVDRYYFEHDVLSLVLNPFFSTDRNVYPPHFILPHTSAVRRPRLTAKCLFFRQAGTPDGTHFLILRQT